MSETETLTLLVAVASAVVGALSAVSSFRSAAAAKTALAETLLAERRTALRDIAVESLTLLAEADRVRRIGEALNSGYATAMMHSGSAQHSGFEEYQSRASNRVRLLEKSAENAARFVNAEAALGDADHDEFQRVLGRLMSDLALVRTTREELERELDGLESRNEAESQRRRTLLVRR